MTGTIDECIEKAMKAKTHPVILADSGDNPTGGGTGDRAEVLEELLRYKVQDTVFAGITDRPATDACYKAGVAQRYLSPLVRRLTRLAAGQSKL